MKNLLISILCAALLLSVVLFKGHRWHRGGGTALHASTEQAESLWRMTAGAIIPADASVTQKIAPGKTAEKNVAFKDKSLARGSDAAPKISNS
jgi:hypothetical protein